MVQAFLKKWRVESDFKAPYLPYNTGSIDRHWLCPFNVYNVYVCVVLLSHYEEGRVCIHLTGLTLPQFRVHPKPGIGALVVRGLVVLWNFRFVKRSGLFCYGCLCYWFSLFKRQWKSIVYVYYIVRFKTVLRDRPLLHCAKNSFGEICFTDEEQLFVLRRQWQLFIMLLFYFFCFCLFNKAKQ